jgi:hypothetical protein
MPRKQRSPDALLSLLATKTVVDLPAIQQALGNTSAMTAFRYLRQISYRRSYDHNGRFYSLYEPSRYDRRGLWSWGGIHFSVDGSLRDTVKRLVRESESGSTQREIQELLRVRVHNTLLDLLHKGEVAREQVADLFVYLHTHQRVRAVQLVRRGEQVASGKTVVADRQLEVDDGAVIQILLVLLRHPGSKAADVVRRLRGHLPPITFEQVRAVLYRYDLEDLGGKGGPSIC